MIETIAIIGTGLIGSSLGLSLKAAGFPGTVFGYDSNSAELALALERGAIDSALTKQHAHDPDIADVIVLAVPVLRIIEWTEALAPVLNASTLVTDVGSTKSELCKRAAVLYNGKGQGRFLPGHPMAGKESGGAAMAEATLFAGATWLFTPIAPEGELEREWRSWIGRMGTNILDMDAQRHDEVCAWVSHLPQMLSTALSALLEETFAGDPEGMAAVQAIGGRALRETTRLGSSPYSMWRDVAMTNAEPIAKAIAALEQRLQFVRENLRTPELREEFRVANRFREKR